ncbi:MAG: MFS transporter [Verrucomicrobiota bacterium]
MKKLFRQRDRIEEADLEKGLKNLIYDGICSQTMGVLTGGAFLVAFALQLGASNFVIGFFAAIMPLCQLLQIPSILLVEKFRNRKALVVIPVIVARSAWLVVPFLPFLFPEPARVPMLVGLLFWYFALSVPAGCAYNSWIRDLIPEERFGKFFGKRWAVITFAGAILTLAASFGIAPLKAWTGSEILPYSLVFGVAGLVGISGSIFLCRTPEPKPEPSTTTSPWKMLAEPFRSADFRKLLFFTGPWNFALNMSAAFFGVYLLKNLGMPISTVIFLAVTSQFVNVFFFRIWGDLADRWNNRSALLVAGQLFFFSVLLWPFTTFPEKHDYTLALLILIHVLVGISTAGVNLCVGTLALKSAPKGKATAYLASNTVVAGIAATLGPLVGGLLGDFFEMREFKMGFTYTEVADGQEFSVPAFNLRGLDFVFLLSAILGAYAMHRLAFVREPSKSEEKLGLSVLFHETRKAVTHVSNVAGLRKLTYFPFEILVKGYGAGRAMVGFMAKPRKPLIERLFSDSPEVERQLESAETEPVAAIRRQFQKAIWVEDEEEGPGGPAVLRNPMKGLKTSQSLRPRLPFAPPFGQGTE